MMDVEREEGQPERIIQVMPETLANKIAAGEVVQRPASAAKELIENALDAGAEDVTLILKSAGRELVQVIDDGCGMSEEDAIACFQRHATSKIRAIEDLERLQTLGFRGEALASIASVAQVELRTRRIGDEVGVMVRVDGGTQRAPEPCATPAGTSIAVRNLFYNVPARRNFLKSPATEFKHLVETFQFLALANPNVAFTLVHDGNEVYRLSAAGREDPHEALRHRVVELFGDEYRDALVPVEEVTSYLSVRGFVGTPARTRRSRGEQFLFVNGRYVKNRYLEHAVATAYGDALPDGAYPFFSLFLDLDPRHVDVNVHPTKAEVKFDDERGVYGFVRAVVKKALGMAELSPQLDAGTQDAAPRRDQGAPPETGESSMDRPNQRMTFTVPAGSGPRSFTIGSSTSARSGGEGRQSGGIPTPPRTPSTGARDRWPGDLTEQLYQNQPPQGERTEHVPSGIDRASGDDVEVPTVDEALLWQLHDAYILTQIRSGLMIVDQNAAHERILYEKAMQSLSGGFGLSQQLLFPQTFHFAPSDYELLKELTPDLKALGFEIEFFSGRSVAVQGVPADIRSGTERNILEEILEQYKTNRDQLQVKGRENLARSIARRSAIRAGTRLNVKAMRSLVDQLFVCEMPTTSPDGRPTLVKISTEELAKRFKHT